MEREKPENKKKIPLKHPGAGILTAVIVIAVIALAVILRMPHFSDSQNGYPPAYLIDRNGLPYFVEMDGYYHVRMADEIALNGRFGLSKAADGTPWDPMSFAPEGRTAVYQDGLVRITVWIWQFLNLFADIDLQAAAFWISGFFAALTVLLVYLLGRRTASFIGASPRITGLVAAALVACAPAFVARTLAGTFDTDLVQAPLAVLLMLFTLRMLTAESFRSCFIFSVAAAVTSAVFTQFWSGSLTFTLTALLAGLCFLLGLLIIRKPKTFFRRPAFAGYLLNLILTAVLILVIQGKEYFSDFFHLVSDVTTGAASSQLPNLLDSVAELRPVPFFPTKLIYWFAGSDQNQMSAVSGIGGIVVFAASLIGIIIIAVRLFRFRAEQETGERIGACLAVFAVWMAASIYALGLGERSVEHLAVPAGILAGITAGMLGRLAVKSRVAAVIVAAICVLFVAPAAVGSYKVYQTKHSQISDASEAAMEWIAENSASENSLIASWWDFGYYYAFASGHPVLWDGGSLDNLRAVVVGKALTCDDLKLSSAIFHMLAGSGNTAPEFFMEKLGPAKGLELLWQVLPMDSGESTAVIQEGFGCSREEAEQAEALVHPDTLRETYLVLTPKMMRTLGWMEYYGNWDFAGDNPKPLFVDYSIKPDGSADMQTAEGDEKQYFENREKEIVWRLFVNGDGDDGKDEYFTLMTETEDPTDSVQIWSVN